MKYSKVYSLMAGLGLMAAVSSAQAMEIKYTDVDLNGDGVVTEAEIINVVQRHFFSMDDDGDSKVSNSEWLNHDNSES